METNVQKWGNSLGIRLSKAIADSYALRSGSRVVVKDVKNGILVQVVKRKRRTLDEMLKGVTKASLHTEIDWGNAEGDEVW